MNGNYAIAEREAGSLAERRFDACYFSQWKAYIDATPQTVTSYTKSVKQLWKYLQETEATQAPRREDVLGFREYLKATKKPATVQSYMTAVKMFFRWTEQEGLYPNIADNIKGAKVDREHKKDPLTAKQVRAMLDSLDRSTLEGKRDYAMLALMLTTGLRTISVSLADIGDIRTVGNNTVLFYRGKGHEEKAISVKLAEPVEDAIRDYLNARGEKDGAAPLFASVSYRNPGARLTTRSVSGIVKETLRGIGLDSERLTAHSLRHTAATVSLMKGRSLEEVQILLDHSNITTTQIYAHALDRMNEQCEETLADEFFS